jgi:hypothetical protein
MPIGTIIAEFFSGIADAWRARRALKAQADLQAGADILNKAIREDTEMREAAARAEAAKRLDADLSNTPIPYSTRTARVCLHSCRRNMRSGHVHPIPIPRRSTV